MSIQSVEAGIHRQHSVLEGSRGDRILLSAEDAGKLLVRPGVRSVRNGATLVLVDAHGNEYIVKDFYKKASAHGDRELQAADEVAGAERASDEDEVVSRKDAESEESDVLVAAASLEETPGALAEVQVAQAPAGDSRAESERGQQAGKEEERNDEEAYHWPTVIGLGLLGAGLIGSMSGGGAAAPAPAPDTSLNGKTIAIAAVSGDTGVSSSDFITSEQALTISGTSDAADGTNVAIKVNGTVVGYTTVAGGVWSYDHTGVTLAAGSYTLDADLVDAALNVAATAVDRALMVDTSGTTDAAGAADTAIAGKVIAVTAVSGDGGMDANDFITSDQTLVISGTSDAADGANVAVKVNGAIVGYTTVTGGVWSYNHTGTTLAAGSYTLDADLIDAAGNVAGTAADRALDVDTLADEASIAGKVIAVTAISNDTGVLGTDFITSDTTLTISGTSDATNGANVAVKVNGTIVGYTTVTGGVWSFDYTGTALAAGNYTLDADLVDAAGNVAATAADRALVVDTSSTTDAGGAADTAIAGKVIAVTAISGDTGVSSSDFITNDQTLTISGTSDASNGANVAVKVNGTIVGYTTVTGGVWSYNHTGTTLVAGSYTLDADLVDAAGNVAGTAADRAITVDTVADEAAITGKVIAVTAISGDTGVSSSDFVTRDQTLTISGTSDASNGAHVAVKVNGTIVGYTTVTGGVWSYDHTGTTLAAGSYTLDADLVDAAGNVAVSAADRILTVDTAVDPVADAAIVGKVIAITGVANDTGVSTSDFHTRDSTLNISGTSNAADGALVAVKLDGALIGYTTVSGGAWSFDHTGTSLSDGEYQIGADLVDAAGNMAVSAADRLLSVDNTIDPVADVDVNGRLIAVTAVGSDTGVSGTDLITNDQTLTFAGTSNAANGANVAVKIDGIIVGYTTVTGGVWSYNHTGTTLAPGSYTLDADLIDAAGNVAASAADRIVTVDTTVDPLADAAISGKVIAVTAISNDTGTDGNDFITNDTTLTISGTSNADNGANVAVKLDGSVIGYTTVTGGVWSYDHSGTPLAGSYTLSADLIDTAGNVAASAADQALLVEATLELLATPLEGVTNLDVKSALVLEFNQDISLGDGEIRLLDMMDTAGWIMSNTTTGVSRQDVTDNDVVITLTAGVVTGMTVGGVDYTALGTGGITLADLQASVSISGNKLIIDPAGLDSASGSDWDFDFDFGANYRLEIDANLVKTQNGLINFAGISGGTGIDFTTVAPVGNNTGAASQKMNANGDLEASYIYHHGHAGEVGGLEVSMNFTTGNHALVIETGGGSSQFIPIAGLGGNINLTGFTANDLIYHDNMGDMTMLTTDGAHAAGWTGSHPEVAQRFQDSDGETQMINFVDYATTGWSYMGTLNYGQADGRFENALHHNANVLIFG